MDRIHKKIYVDHDMMNLILRTHFSLDLMSFDFMSDGGSTSNYKVVTRQGTYLIKFYPPQRDNSGEMALMKDLESLIKIPKIHVYDGTRSLIDTDYMIMDFIEGQTLRQYVGTHGMSKVHAETIGYTMATIHSKTYESPHLYDKVKTPVLSILDQYKYFIGAWAGHHMGETYCRYMTEIISTYEADLTLANLTTVRTHGDLNPGNILVDEGGSLWFIDFEYGQATSPYMDFGKFLRKREGYSSHLNAEVLQAIHTAYGQGLAKNWVHLSMLCDPPALLRMIDKPEVSPWRVAYIQKAVQALYDDVDKKTYR